MGFKEFPRPLDECKGGLQGGPEDGGGSVQA